MGAKDVKFFEGITSEVKTKGTYFEIETDDEESLPQNLDGNDSDEVEIVEIGERNEKRSRNKDIEIEEAGDDYRNEMDDSVRSRIMTTQFRDTGRTERRNARKPFTRFGFEEVISGTLSQPADDEIVPKSHSDTMHRNDPSSRIEHMKQVMHSLESLNTWELVLQRKDRKTFRQNRNTLKKRTVREF